MLAKLLRAVRIWRRKRFINNYLRRARALHLTIPEFTDAAFVERQVFGDNLAFPKDDAMQKGTKP